MSSTDCCTWADTAKGGIMSPRLTTAARHGMLVLEFQPMPRVVHSDGLRNPGEMVLTSRQRNR